MLTVIKKDNTTEEFIDEKIVDAVSYTHLTLPTKLEV